MSERDDQDRALLPFDAGDAEGGETSGRLIRRQWHDGRWFFSVIDVVALLTDSPDPGAYWRKLKQRMRAQEGASEVVTKCHELKMRSLDGKNYKTDAADVETMLRIVQSIPSPKAEPVKQWLARVGTERLEQIAESDILAGLSEDQRRLVVRGQLAEHNRRLADTAHIAGETARDIAARKGLARGQRILDYMGSTELALNYVRSTQAEDKLRREGITERAEANQIHFEVGRAVRRFVVEDLGGTPPELLPTPEKSIQQLQRQEAKRLEAERQPSLFPQLADTNFGWVVVVS